jgi:aryl-alcohol dehydrogenase-like predicted oxidoreductase
MGFGAMQLPGPGVFGPPKDRTTALAILRRVVDAGVNHIDTAQFYGPDVANELIREALHPYPEDLVLVSKVGARRDGTGQWMAAQRPEELRGGSRGQPGLPRARPGAGGQPAPPPRW